MNLYELFSLFWRDNGYRAFSKTETDSSNGCSSNCTMILFYFDRHPFILEGCFLILYFPVSFLFL